MLSVSGLVSVDDASIEILIRQEAPLEFSGTARPRRELDSSPPRWIRGGPCGACYLTKIEIDLYSNVFRFYGTTFSGNNQLLISSNGLIRFGVADTSSYNITLSRLAYFFALHWDN